MLQRLRDRMQTQKWLAWVVLGLIGATFIFWGGSNSLDFSGVSKNVAAEVNGEDIPAEEATRAWSQQQANLASQGMTDIPPEQQKIMQANIINGLISEKLIETRVHDQNFRVSDAAILAVVRAMPGLQTDGQFDRYKLNSELARIGMSEGQFVAEQRKQMMESQLEQGIIGSNFLTPAERQRLGNLENEEREVQYLRLATEKFEGTAPIDEAAVKDYLEKNKDRFMTTESVGLEFAELRLEQLGSQVTPTDEDLKKLYEENLPRYTVEEARRARMIIIKVNDGENEAAALKRAESVVADARAGKDFSELAKKHSADAAAGQTDDLGFLTRSQIQDATMADALFALKVGDVSAPFKTQYGYQILKLEQIQAGAVKTFDEAKAELDAQYRTAKAADLFGERAEQITAAMATGNADLDKLSQDLGLTRGSVQNFLRGGGAEPLGSSPELQAAVFSDGALNQGKVSGPITLGEDRLVVFKVTSHQKAEVKPLAAVHDEIVALLRHERGVAAAKAAADGALKKLEAGGKLDEVARELGVAAEPARFVGRVDPQIPAALSAAVFNAPRPTDKPVIKLATLDDGSSALFVLTRTRVSDTSGNPTLVEQLNAKLLQRVSRGEGVAYLDEARRKAKIVTNPKVFGDQ